MGKNNLHLEQVILNQDTDSTPTEIVCDYSNGNCPIFRLKPKSDSLDPKTKYIYLGVLSTIRATEVYIRGKLFVNLVLDWANYCAQVSSQEQNPNDWIKGFQVTDTSSLRDEFLNKYNVGFYAKIAYDFDEQIEFLEE